MSNQDPSERDGAVEPSDAAEQNTAEQAPSGAAEVAQNETPSESQPVAAPESPSTSEVETAERAEATHAEPASESSSEAASASSEATSAAGEGGGVGEGGKKRKRRRRKKKAAEGEGGEQAERPAGPFARFFEGVERKHAFSAGEIVAGRVVRVESGAARIDLFGKAEAVMDALEPSEIAELPTEAQPDEDDVPAGEASESTASESEAGAQEATEAAADPAAEETAPDGAGQEASSAAGEAPEAAAQTTSEAPPVETVHAEETTPQAAEASSEGESPAQDANEDRDEEASAGASSSEAAKATVELPPEVASYVVPALGETSVEEGAIVRGRVISVSESGHVAILNRYIDRKLVRARLRALRGQRVEVEGLVFGFNRGGFDVLVDGVRCFCPASAMSLEPIDDPNAFVGKKLTFTLPPAKGGGARSVVVSRRPILERERRKATRERFKSLEVGQRFEARVVDIRDFGVVVDIGDGVEGLVHVSELSWTRGVRPSDVVKRGEMVNVEVLEVRPITRKDRHGKLSLSIRKTLPDPWEEHKELLKEGAFFDAKVVRLTEFGAFLEIAPGIDGLLHISEIGGRDLKHAKQALQVGDELPVLIERVDRGQRRVGLTKLSAEEAEKIRSGELDPSSLKRPPRQGDVITVVVERVEHHGVIVQVEGVLGKKGRGYISNRDLGSEESKKSIQQGAKIEVKVVGVDRDGGLKCSIRAREIDEERKAVKDYRRESSKQGFGTLADLLREKLENKN